MKAYGRKRSDNKTCRYGCCGVKKSNIENQNPANRKRIDKAARHRARQFKEKISELE